MALLQRAAHHASVKTRRFETLKRGRRRLEEVVLHSALLEMSLPPGQMAVVKVLLPSLEVFDSGVEIFFYLREQTTSAVLGCIGGAFTQLPRNEEFLF